MSKWDTKRKQIMSIIKPILINPSEGRKYKIGKSEKTEVTFKADGAEVDNKYSITEWWMDENGPGPEPHIHETQDELIYILSGPVAILIADTWTSMDKGGTVVIPAGTTHTFKNDSDQRVGILNIFLSGAYEAFMPQITEMYSEK